MYLSLERTTDNGIQTTGKLNFHDTTGKKIAQFDTLELSYHLNKRRISCVPCGTYIVEPHLSFRHGRCFKLVNVSGRDNILIHKGNFNHDTKGCILIGQGFRDINNDFQLDVLNSATAMRVLRTVLVSVTTITITNKINDYELK
jgi:hypothetical protein